MIGDQWAPSQCSTKGACFAVPTAKQLVALGHAMSARSIPVALAGLALGMTNHTAAAPAGTGIVGVNAVARMVARQIVEIDCPRRRVLSRNRNTRRSDARIGTPGNPSKW